jgi:hypothetical protein
MVVRKRNQSGVALHDATRRETVGGWIPRSPISQPAWSGSCGTKLSKVRSGADVVRGAAGMPVVDVVMLGVLVVDALPPREVARVRPDVAAVEQIDRPPQLVVLAVVDRVAGGDREVQRSTGRWAHAKRFDRLNQRLGHVGGEHLLRAVGGGELDQ